MKHAAFAILIFASAVLGESARANDAFSLRSATFAPNGIVPAKMFYDGDGCRGQNRSPELHWSAPPPGTKSYLLTVVDPDASLKGGWWHWIRFAIAANVRSLAENDGRQPPLRPSPGIDATNTFLSPGYDGPCPPPGERPHRYVFTLYALDVAAPPNIGGSATGPQIVAAVERHVLGRAELTGRAGR